MSVVFPFILPTTGALVLSTHIRSIDYQPIVLNADSARAGVRDALKRAKRADNPDILGVIKSLEEYIPYLYTITQGINEGDFDLVTEVLPTWRMPLRTSKSQINVVEPPKVQLMGFEFERGMVLLTYALCLIVQSDKVVQSAGEDKAQSWKQATSYLTKAESVLAYLSNVPPCIDQQQSNNSPIDLQPTTVSGLSNMVKGSLHLLILYKTVSETYSTTSAGLLSRIAIYASEKFSSASQLLQKPQKRQIKVKVGFSDGLTLWLSNAQSYSIASAYRYMALESANGGQVGRALGLLTLAKNTIGEIKNKKDSEPLCEMAQKLKTTVEESYQSYKAENDRLSFQSIPDLKDLQHNWPSGREATTLHPPWSPPVSLVREYRAVNSIPRGGYY